MKKSAILIKAKAKLAACWSDRGNKEKFICFSIDAVETPNNERKCVKIKDLIQKRLGDNASLEQWLLAVHNIRIQHSGAYYGVAGVRKEAQDKKYKAYYTRIQKTRHAWIDSLIAEFRAEGD